MKRLIQPAGPGLVVPRLIPPVARQASHQFEDYLYDYGKAVHDLAMFKVRWTRYKQGLPEDERETIEKIERLFHRKNPQVSA